MKILFIRVARKISGAETYNAILLERIKTYSSQEIAFLTNVPELTGKVSQFGINAKTISLHVDEIGTKKQLLKAFFLLHWFYYQYFTSIRPMEKGKKFDLICLQSMTEKIFLTGWLKIFRYKVVWIEHGPLFVSQVSRIILWMYVLVSRFVDGIIAVSEDTKKDLLAGRIVKEKIAVIYIGVDVKQITPSTNTAKRKEKKRLGIDEKQMVVGFLGTVTADKGIEQFMFVASKLVAKSKMWHFVVIGDGPKLAWTKKQVKEKNMENAFTFTGFVPHPEYFLNAVDVLLFPTQHTEGISMALLETQAMGIPIVASDMGGNSEIITHAKDGFLYKKDDMASMESKLIQLAGNSRLRATIRKAARKNVEARFNIQRQAKLFVDYFTYICSH